MTFPAQLLTVEVRGRFVRVDGTPARGRVTFTPLVPAVSHVFEFIIIDSPVSAVLNSSGSFRIVVPAGDDPNLADRLYLRVDVQVEERITTYTVLVPQTAVNGGIDLVDLTPVTEVDELSPYLTGRVVGQPGGVAPLDDDGVIPVRFLPPIATSLAGLSDVRDADGATTGQVLIRNSEGFWVPGAGTGEFGSLAGFEWRQRLAQSVWTIDHNLGRYPVAWSLFDDTGRTCDNYSVFHDDLDTSRVLMDTPTAGLIRMI